MEPLRPRPVPGPREYALAFDVRNASAPYEVHKELLAALEAAGAEEVARPDPVTSTLTFRQPYEGEAWAGALALQGIEGGVRVRVRLRPGVLTEYTFWPPEPLRAPLRAFLEAHPCFAERQRIEPRVLDVAPGEVEGFARGVVRGPDRALPVVVLTPGRWGEPDAAQGLARDLLGVATVARMTTQDAALALAAHVGGKERGVYGGAVRLYRPGFDPADDPLDHDLLITRYLDTRLAGGRPLAGELARRILPMAGEPIRLPQAAAPPAPPAPAARAPAPTPASSLPRLEQDVRRLDRENAELREEVRRLKEGLQAALTHFEELEYLIPRTTDPGLPWPLLNPRARPVELAPSFVGQVAAVARDGSLAAEVRKKMEAVLLDPEGYGKDLRGVRKGQRATYVARNYRLVWSVEGDTVRFVLVVSKEDPEYSPFGA